MIIFVKMTTSKDVKHFYETFDFEKVLKDAPKPIQDFLDGEIEFIKKHIPVGKEILEVGSGYGRLLEILSATAKKAVGIDFSNYLLERSRKTLADKENVELHFMYAEKMSFKDETFDYVVCLDNTFGNMPGIELNVIKEMTRVCKKG
ncbi:class I SAM-dependent methyltransferase [Candidatus Woesearchaeota archaeon]|nr:class I SAM-dependent methyltransferase [Candidatus Woesearchaeota archaeon]